MGKGHNVTSSSSGDAQTQQQTPKQQFTWSEVSRHTERTDKWFVIDGEVYDITRWSQKHPGGSRVISHYAGQDASEAFRAFHNDQAAVRKYLKPIHVGTLRPSEAKEEEIKKDMEELRETATKMGLFKPSITFYTLMCLQVVALEIFSYWVMGAYGTSWIPWTIALVAHATMQVTAGWLQHDFGHLSVFKSTFWNKVFHQWSICISKGTPASWWNHLHYQHHAKPNVIGKDPDVRLEALFVIGETMAKKGAKRKKTMPYNWQHRYFFATLPPLLFPTYFQYMIFYHVITRKRWLDLAMMMTYYSRFFYMYIPLLGLRQCLTFYFLMRVIESNWFVWVTQSNHIPMEIDEDKSRPWLSLQLAATCDIEKGFFNDWFTGHLNFQIEHHLFPTMPRHNLYKIQPMAKSLCEKHGIPHITKTLFQSWCDIVNTLEHSGQIWDAYYHAYHMD